MGNKFKNIRRYKHKAFIFPAVIILIELLFNFIIIPQICGDAILPNIWLFADPQSIIDDISNFNNVNLDAKEIMLICIFEYILLLLLFIISLFFVGKRLHTEPKSNTTRKELYIITQDIIKSLKAQKTSIETKKLNDLIDDVKQLEEKLSIESDFGHGNGIVIDCEHEIRRRVELIFKLSTSMEDKTYIENINMINTEVLSINKLLCKRTELKKI